MQVSWINRRVTRVVTHVSYIPERNWAVGEYAYRMNNGLSVVGSVEYEDHDGIPSRSMPKRIEFAMDRPGSARAEYVLQGLSVRVEEINDDIFALETFGLGVKKSRFAYVLVAIGCVAIMWALFTRVRSAHRAKRQNG
jgi:hypothetical protein